MLTGNSDWHMKASPSTSLRRLQTSIALMGVPPVHRPVRQRPWKFAEPRLHAIGRQARRARRGRPHARGCDLLPADLDRRRGRQDRSSGRGTCFTFPAARGRVGEFRITALVEESASDRPYARIVILLRGLPGRSAPSGATWLRPRWGQVRDGVGPHQSLRSFEMMSADYLEPWMVTLWSFELLLRSSRRRALSNATSVLFTRAAAPPSRSFFCEHVGAVAQIAVDRPPDVSRWSFPDAGLADRCEIPSSRVAGKRFWLQGVIRIGDPYVSRETSAVRSAADAQIRGRLGSHGAIPPPHTFHRRPTGRFRPGGFT